MEFSKALANQGANIALVARREEKLKEVQKEIEKLGVTCRYYLYDVTGQIIIVDGGWSAI